MNVETKYKVGTAIVVLGFVYLFIGGFYIMANANNIAPNDSSQAGAFMVTSTFIIYIILPAIAILFIGILLRSSAVVAREEKVQGDSYK